MGLVFVNVPKVANFCNISEKRPLAKERFFREGEYLPRTTCREPPLREPQGPELIERAGRTTERLVRKRGDEPRSKFATKKRCIACPEQLERGECSGVLATLWSIIHD